MHYFPRDTIKKNFKGARGEDCFDLGQPGNAKPLASSNLKMELCSILSKAFSKSSLRIMISF